MEAGEEVLRVLEVCEAGEQIQEVIVSPIEEDFLTNSPPVASWGPGVKPPSQVGWMDGSTWNNSTLLLHVCRNRL